MRKETYIGKQKRLRLGKRRSIKKQIRKMIAAGILQRVPEQYRGAIRLKCPSELSLQRNFDETVDFLISLKDLSRVIFERKKIRPTTPVHYSVGLKQLEKVSLRCAVIFAAEIDRLRRIAGDELFYGGAIKDDNEAISLLRQMGLFRLIGANINDKELPQSSPSTGHRDAIPLMSGLKCEEKKFLDFEEAVQSIFDH